MLTPNLNGAPVEALYCLQPKENNGTTTTILMDNHDLNHDNPTRVPVQQPSPPPPPKNLPSHHYRTASPTSLSPTSFSGISSPTITITTITTSEASATINGTECPTITTTSSSRNDSRLSFLSSNNILPLWLWVILFFLSSIVIVVLLGFLMTRLWNCAKWWRHYCGSCSCCGSHHCRRKSRDHLDSYQASITSNNSNSNKTKRKALSSLSNDGGSRH